MFRGTFTSQAGKEAPQRGGWGREKTISVHIPAAIDDARGMIENPFSGETGGRDRSLSELQGESSVPGPQFPLQRRADESRSRPAKVWSAPSSPAPSLQTQLVLGGVSRPEEEKAKMNPTPLHRSLYCSSPGWGATALGAPRSDCSRPSRPSSGGVNSAILCFCLARLPAWAIESSTSDWTPLALPLPVSAARAVNST